MERPVFVAKLLRIHSHMFFKKFGKIRIVAEVQIIGERGDAAPRNNQRAFCLQYHSFPNKFSSLLSQMGFAKIVEVIGTDPQFVCIKAGEAFFSEMQLHQAFELLQGRLAGCRRLCILCSWFSILEQMKEVQENDLQETLIGKIGT